MDRESYPMPAIAPEPAKLWALFSHSSRGQSELNGYKRSITIPTRAAILVLGESRKARTLFHCSQTVGAANAPVEGGGSGAGPTIEQSPAAVLGRADDDGVPALRRRQSATEPVRLQPGVAGWQQDGACLVPQPGGPGPWLAACQPRGRPHSSACPAVAPSRG